MGTNYYWEPAPPCPHCGRTDIQLHIGRSSGDWCFSLHVFGKWDAMDIAAIPADGVRSLEDWKRLWATGGRIVTEYNEELTVGEMLAIITEREGLRRHPIGPRCIAHGAGPWDLTDGISC